MQYSEAGLARRARPAELGADARGCAALDDPLGCEAAGWVRGVVQPSKTAETSRENAGGRIGDLPVYPLEQPRPQVPATGTGELVIHPREC
jgi:hypothetical protein